MFPCTSCGACCRTAYAISLYGDRGDGTCAKLGEDDRCMIYESRPLVCRVDEMKAVLFPETSMEQWYEANAAMCNKLIEEQDLDDKFLVQIGG